MAKAKPLRSKTLVFCRPIYKRRVRIKVLVGLTGIVITVSELLCFHGITLECKGSWDEAECFTAEFARFIYVQRSSHTRREHKSFSACGRAGAVCLHGSEVASAKFSGSSYLSFREGSY